MCPGQGGTYVSAAHPLGVHRGSYLYRPGGEILLECDPENKARAEEAFARKSPSRSSKRREV